MKKAKELFTILGRVKLVEGKKKFVCNSAEHMKSRMNNLPLDKEIACTFSEHTTTKSDSQHNYHYELLSYIADHTGHTKEELHDAFMRIKFGTKTVQIGGFKVSVRKSIANSSYIPKAQMAELIEFDLQSCKDLGIRVPTAEELGYITK